MKNFSDSTPGWLSGGDALPPLKTSRGTVDPVIGLWKGPDDLAILLTGKSQLLIPWPSNS